MKNKRREFIRKAGLAGFGAAGAGLFNGFAGIHTDYTHTMNQETVKDYSTGKMAGSVSLIGAYGSWAASLLDRKIPSLSFRNKEWTNAAEWRATALKRLIDRLAIPDMGKTPSVNVKKQYEYNGLHIEELSWQLPYGPPTDAILLKPANATGPLPGILAFHDHGGNKYFGTKKITRTPDQHALMAEHQKHYYEGAAWANEMAARGYVVLVSDAFPFASRRVLYKDVPEHLHRGLNDDNPEDPKNIEAYNNWAGQHEHIMAKSLFSAGTTWPAVFFAEDRVALDILSARKDVDSGRIGCAGLSGGGMRTIFMGGIDPRIKCAVCVGFMSTWKDFVLDKSFTHTWMTYVPLLPNEMDLPEILGLRVPLPVMVLNDIDDDLFTIGEMRRADDILREVYKKAGAEASYKCNFHPGEHKFDRKMQGEAFDWFDRWLK